MWARDTLLLALPPSPVEVGTHPQHTARFHFYLFFLSLEGVFPSSDGDKKNKIQKPIQLLRRNVCVHKMKHAVYHPKTALDVNEINGDCSLQQRGEAAVVAPHSLALSLFPAKNKILPSPLYQVLKTFACMFFFRFFFFCKYNIRMSGSIDHHRHFT